MSAVKVEVPVDVKVDHEALNALADRFDRGDMTPNEFEAEASSLVSVRVGSRPLDIRVCLTGECGIAIF